MRQRRFVVSVVLVVGWAIVLPAPPVAAGSDAIAWEQTQYTVGESDDSVDVVATRANEGGFVEDCSVGFTTSDGSAVDDTDYDGQFGSLTWPAGSDGQLRVTIPILPDTMVENDETFQVTLMDAVGQSCFITTPMTAVTIVDDDAPAPPPPPPPPPPGPPPPPPPTEATRVELDAGSNVASAIAWSQVTNPDPTFAGVGPLAATVLLGRDDVPADSLASGGAQGALGAPLLLTAPDALDPRTAEELQRLGAEQVVLLGGPQALSLAVVQALEDAGYDTRRLAGASRLETATAIAADVAPVATRAVLARAFAAPDATDPTQVFADALAGGALAAHLRVPLLLTETARLSQPTADYLASSAIEEVVILGGPAAVSEDVASALEDLEISVDRLSGATRADTAVAIATGGLGLADAAAADAIALVDGQDEDAWADAFPAALLASRVDLALLLSNDDDLAAVTESFLTPAPVTLYCGTTVAAQACSTAFNLLT